MANENDAKAAPVAAKQTVKAGGKASGTIVRNRNLNTWLALNSGRKIVQTGSKETLVKLFPNFTVKE